MNIHKHFILSAFIGLEIGVVSALTSLTIVHHLDLDDPQVEYVRLNPTRCAPEWEIDEREPYYPEGCNIQVAK